MLRSRMIPMEAPQQPAASGGRPPPVSALRGASGGGSSAKRPRRQADGRAVTISKELSRLLRHAPPPGAMDAQGYVPLDILMGCMRSRPTAQELRDVVASNDKQRFVLEESGVPRVRAAQGHSIALQQPLLAPVTAADAVPVALHATSEQGWAGVCECGELRRMSRTHIHFATAPQLLRTNSWARVLLRLRLQDALDAGHLFWLSSNGVLLCEGPLPVSLLEPLAPDDAAALWASGG